MEVVEDERRGGEGMNKESHGMKNRKGTAGLLVSMLVLGITLKACGFLGNETSWQEEVLLHDGSKIVVDRSIKRAGRHEIGQQPPVGEERLTITMPQTNEQIPWRSDYSQDVGYADLSPIAIGIVYGTAYLVSDPVGCLSYNKWGRPNPPYVIFKYDGKKWQRIPPQELPAEIKVPNLIISSPDNEVERTGKSFVPAGEVTKINSALRQLKYKTILREPVKVPKSMECPEMIRTEDGWDGIDWFSTEPNYDACVKMCERRKVSPQNCPCDRLFIKNNTEK